MNQPEITADVLQAEETRYLLKSPGFVASLSGLVMGLGQLFNGQIKKAVVFFAAEVGVFLYLWDFLGPRVVADTFLALAPPLVYQSFLVFLATGGVALWVYNIRDAYHVAQFMDFIFDRSTPVLDDDERAFLEDSLSVTHLGIRVHRGLTRKAMFIGTALVLYSLALVILGARFAANSAEIKLKASIDASPSDPTPHLRLGELLMAHGETDAAKKELETAMALAKSQSDTRTVYGAHTALARLFADLGQGDRANALLKDALALFSPAVQPTSDAVDAAQPALAASDGSPDGSVREATTATEPQRPPTAVRVKTAVESPVSGDQDGERTAKSGSPTPAVVRKPANDEVEAATPIAGDPPELLSRALANFKVKNYGESRRLLAACARKDHRDATYHSLSGRVHAAVGEWEPAITELARALELGCSAEQRLVLAEAYTKTGRPEQATAQLRAYLRTQPYDPRGVMLLSEILRRSGRLTEAARLVNEALIVNPDRSDLLTAHFDIALASPNEETAFQTALKVLKGSEVDAQLARSLVTRALDVKQFSLAHRMANVLLSRRASDSLGYVLKGAVLLRENKPRQAMDYFEKASSMGSQEPELFYEIAVLYRKLGKNGRAIESLKHALELNPGSAACARELGSVLFTEGRFEAARAAYQKALKIAPSDTLAAIGAGECHLRLGRTGDARDTFERVLAIDPGNAAAKRWLAVAAAGHKPERKMASGSWINDSVLGAATVPEKESEAVPSAEPRAPAESSPDEPASAGSPEQDDQSRGYVDSSSKTGGTHPATVPEKRVPAAPPVDRSLDDERLRKAQRAQLNGDLASAEQICRLVLAGTPDHAAALYRLALIQKGRKQTQKAIDTMELARRSAPSDAAILLELGQLYTETSQTGPAIRRLEEHIRLDPSNLAGHYSLGVNYERAKVYARAEREYRTILSLYPQFHEAHDYLGNLYFSQRRFKLAAGEYEKLARSKPTEPKPRFKMAVALFYQNDHNRARQEFSLLSRGLPAGDSLRPKVQGYLGKL